MKTLKFKAFCYYEITDDTSKLPDIYPTKKACVQMHRSYHGHPCDDPEKRGIIAECQVTVNLPPMIKATPEIRHYMQSCLGQPAMMVVGDNAQNQKEFERAIREQRAKLRKLGKVA